jgi:hypothetical protein
MPEDAPMMTTVRVECLFMSTRVIDAEIEKATDH